MSAYLRPDGGLLDRLYSKDDSAPTVRRVRAEAQNPSDTIEWLVSEVLELRRLLANKVDKPA